MRLRRTTILGGILSLLTLSISAQGTEIEGSWRADLYVLKDGSELPVDGLIFFTEHDWTVLFFVTEDGEVRRGSGEGGTYTIEGDALTFLHLYHLSAGEEVASLPEAPLRMSVRDPGAAQEEHCRVEISGEQMTLFFPSGNRMIFSRR